MTAVPTVISDLQTRKTTELFNDAGATLTNLFLIKKLDDIYQHINSYCFWELQILVSFSSENPIVFYLNVLQ